MKKIKCYYFWDKNLLSMKNTFELTLNRFTDNIKTVPVEFEYNSKSSNFGTLDFRNLMLEKTTKVRDIIKEGMAEEEEILISDIDIVIYGNFESELSLGDKDILFQKETREGGVNTGFIFLKCNESTLSLWEDTISEITNFDKASFINEQAAINKLLANREGLKWGVFDDSIWAISNSPMPENILLHHANCTAANGYQTSYELKVQQIMHIMNVRHNAARNEIAQILGSTGYWIFKANNQQ
jgi:hypothetical protein